MGVSRLSGGVGGLCGGGGVARAALSFAASASAVCDFSRASLLQGESSSSSAMPVILRFHPYDILAFFGPSFEQVRFLPLVSFWHFLGSPRLPLP